LNKYDNYKPTSCEWIGLIPSNWNIRRIKYEITIEKGCNPKEKTFDEKGKPYLSMEYLRGNPSQIFYVENYENYLVVNINQILLLWDGSNAGEFIKSKEGVLSSTMAILDILSLNPNYVWYFVKVFEIYLKESTIGMGIPHVDGDELKNQLIVIPTSDEQIAIANYLDEKTAKIDMLVSNKQKLIEFLKEERTAIINQAVTKGINPNTKLKPSGIEWLGDIPTHWLVKKVRNVCKVQGRIGYKGYRTADLVSQGEGAITLGATHITRDHKINLSEPVYLNWDKYYESPEIIVKKGDIVFTQRGAYLGKVALIDNDYGEVTINPSLILLKEIIIKGNYLKYYLVSKYIRSNIDLIASNTAIPMISQEQLSNFYCLCPPDDEQIQIVNYIETETKKIDTTISKIEKEIELLQEYRTALISEVVTGKIDVR
jgi:type I restriction enzyme, S subunit